MQPGVGAAGSRSTSSGNGGGRFWTVMTTSLYALLTVWRLAITKINKALLFLDYGWRRRTDFFHKVRFRIDRPIDSINEVVDRIEST